MRNQTWLDPLLSVHTLGSYASPRLSDTGAGREERKANGLALKGGKGPASPQRRNKRKERKLSACRGEGSVAGLQLRVRFVPAALLAMLRTALALQCVSKARDWTGHAAWTVSLRLQAGWYRGGWRLPGLPPGAGLSRTCAPARGASGQGRRSWWRSRTRRSRTRRSRGFRAK
jgi:hypothetical protein